MCSDFRNNIFMITRIQLDNFKSFKHIDFNLCNKAKSPRKLLLIYGENGAGKSNLISAISFLCEIIETLDVQDTIEDFLSEKDKLDFNKPNFDFLQDLVSSMRTTKKILTDYSMIGSDEGISATYSFIIGSKEGRYSIKFNRSEIIYEKLEYVWASRKGTYFECTSEGCVINPLAFSDSELLQGISNDAKRFWGKHSLFAVIFHYLHNSSKLFEESGVSSGLKEILDELNHLCCNVQSANARFDKLAENDYLLMHLENGQIPRDEESRLKKIEKALSIFFVTTNSNIKGVFYKTEYKGSWIEYELYFKKMISSQIRHVSIQDESSGTQALLDVFVYLMEACEGNVVAVDELDSGIHDLLFQKVLKDVFPHISGQLIFTTHNTLLIDNTPFARDSAYILREIENGNKEVLSISKTNTRTYLDNNVRSKYLSDDYQGLPCTSPCDVDMILAMMR